MSTRFAGLVLALLLVTLIPIVRHQYVGAEADDGRRASRLPLSFGGLSPRLASGADMPWVSEAFATTDWVERRLAGPGGAEIVLLAVRSYDVKRLYHHPELAILHGMDLRSAGVRYGDSSPGVPLHALTGENGGMAAYVLLQGNTFVADPVTFQLRSAVRLVFTRREPMTLLFAYDTTSTPGSPVESSPVATVVVDAAKQFLAQSPREGS